jgi:predicted nucleic acid-binding protein
VRRHFARLRENGDLLVTSNLVLAETATRLRYDAGLPHALAFRDVVDEAASSGRLAIRYADAAAEVKAWAVMAQYADLTLSFADCVGAVTAREAPASAVFGLDNDFRVLGFALEP